MSSNSKKECSSCKHFISCEPSTLGTCDLYEETSLEELMRAFGAVFCHECEFMEENERCSYFSTTKTDVFCGPNEFCSAGKLKTNTEEE